MSLLAEANSRVVEACRAGAKELDLAGLQLPGLPPILIALCRLASASITDVPAKDQATYARAAEEVAIARLSPEAAAAAHEIKSVQSGLADAALEFDELPEETTLTAVHRLRALVPILARVASENKRSEQLASLLDQVDEDAATQSWSSVRRRLDAVDRVLSRSRLTDFSKELLTTSRRFAERLAYLDLSHNSLTELDDALGSLHNLKSIDVSDNLLTELGPEVIGLPRLAELVASGCRLQQLHIPNDCLSSLAALDLSHNELVSVPPELFALPSLTHLNLSWNSIQLVELPDGELAPLKELDLGNNVLDSIASDLGRLSALETLALNANNLEQLPESVRDLEGLAYLDLEENRLQTLDALDGLFSQLSLLNVESNDLTTLPLAFAQLSPYADVLVGRNPLSRTVLAAADQGTSALLAYIESLGEATQPCREAKLILIGEGNVGKTSLAASLAGEPFVADRETTHGIEIRQLSVQDSDGVVYQLNTWDFGGQEIYRVTHQFYFSQDAVFLIVWRPREGFEQGGVSFWLERVRRLVGDRGRILLVSTHSAEGRQTHIDFEELEFVYHPLISGRFEVDNRTGDAIDSLARALGSVVTGLDHIDDPLSERWIQLRDELLAEPGPFVLRQDYDRMCAAHGVEPSAGDAWLKLLHALGYLIYFADDFNLSSIIITDPELLARAVSFVLEDRSVIEGGGIVEHSHLVAVWRDNLHLDEAEYGLFPYLLRLMERNDVSIRIPETETSLIAPVVGHHRPLDLPWEPGDIDPTTSELRLWYRFPMEPVGLIPWLIVRCSRWAVSRHWRRGLFVESSTDGSSAVIELSSDFQLDVSVRGPYPAGLFAVLRSEVEWLLDKRWPHLKYETKVPCPTCRVTRPTQVPGVFHPHTLANAAQRGIPELQCSECFNMLRVADLLLGFDPGSDAAGERFQSVFDEVMKLQLQIRHVADGVGRLERGQQDVDAAFGAMFSAIRMLRQTVALVAADCPRLFSIWPVGSKKWTPKNFWTHPYRLQLWCEHPGEVHPVGDPYEFTRSREWFLRAIPLIDVMARLLRLVPVLSAVTRAEMNTKQWSEVESQLAAMSAIGEAVWDLHEDPALTSMREAISAGGFELRALKELLHEIDPPPQQLRGLRPVSGPGAEVLWVCERHYPEYDPGLPVLQVPAIST